MYIDNNKSKIIRPISDCSKLYFYQKADTLYQLTYTFISRYLMQNDRTRDQMLQAARSGKQNIVEGIAEGVTSIKMEVQLLNVLRASIRELKEDYIDYLKTRGLSHWLNGHPRFTKMVQYCKKHNLPGDYVRYFPMMNDEALANLAITLSCQIDVLVQSYQTKIINESSFACAR